MYRSTGRSLQGYNYFCEISRAPAPDMSASTSNSVFGTVKGTLPFVDADVSSAESREP